jgi:fucose 4-O-acetylase-like acetyltransferase
VNHATGWGFTSLLFWTDRYAPVAVPDFSGIGSWTYYALRALEQLIMFSLPSFLLVSGFFVAAAAGRARVLRWSQVRGRLRTLLIPYLLWSIVIFAGRFVEGKNSSDGYLEQLIFGRAAEPYYYITLLTQLFLLAPLLVAGMVTSRWKTVLLATAALQFVVQAARYPVLLGWQMPLADWIVHQTPGWSFPHMVFWFAFGVAAGFHLNELMAWTSQWRRALPWVTVALGVLAFVEWELIFRASGSDWLRPVPTVVDSLYAMAFILTFLAYARQLPECQPLDALGARSFGVYLIHAPVLELASRASYHLAPLLLAHQLAFLALLVLAGVGVPLLLMTMVRRSPVRPLYSYLFG